MPGNNIYPNNFNYFLKTLEKGIKTVKINSIFKDTIKVYNVKRKIVKVSY